MTVKKTLNDRLFKLIFAALISAFFILAYVNIEE